MNVKILYLGLGFLAGNLTGVAGMLIAEKVKISREPREVEELDFPEGINESDEVVHPSGSLSTNIPIEKPDISDVYNSIVDEMGYDQEEHPKEVVDYSHKAERNRFQEIDREEFKTSVAYDAYSRTTCSWYPDEKILVDLGNDFYIINQVEDTIGSGMFGKLEASNPGDELYLADHELKICYELLPTDIPYNEDLQSYMTGE